MLRAEYNIDRPHQSLAMAFPASRFMPPASSLGLQVPAQLTSSTGQPKAPRPAQGPSPAHSPPVDAVPGPVTVAGDDEPAWEVDLCVPRISSRGCDQQSCSPSRLAMMITGHVPAVHVPPDHAARRGAAARPA
jgi:hypothetical protein